MALSPTEKEFLKLFVDCAKTGNFKKLNEEYLKTYQAVLWCRIDRKRTDLQSDFLLVKKAFKLKQEWDKA